MTSVHIATSLAWATGKSMFDCRQGRRVLFPVQRRAPVPAEGDLATSSYSMRAARGFFSRVTEATA